MVLSDSELIKALELKKLIIDPPPKKEQISPSAIDLHLSSEIMIFKKQTHSIIDLAKYNYHEFKETFLQAETMGERGYELEPNNFILGITKEHIELPISSCLCARVEGRSSFARLGLVIHMTAPTIHAGFRGNIVLEIKNHGLYSLKLTPNIRICQSGVRFYFSKPR